jgi:hypothetical protein
MSLPQLLGTGRGIATLVAEAAALAAMSPFLLIELGSLHAYAGGWLSLWNLLDVVTYSLQVGLCEHCRCVRKMCMLNTYSSSGSLASACSVRCWFVGVYREEKGGRAEAEGGWLCLCNLVKFITCCRPTCSYSQAITLGVDQ